MGHSASLFFLKEVILLVSLSEGPMCPDGCTIHSSLKTISQVRWTDINLVFFYEYSTFRAPANHTKDASQSRQPVNGAVGCLLILTAAKFSFSSPGHARTSQRSLEDHTVTIDIS